MSWSFGTQQNIGMGVIGDLRIAVPPIDEQSAALKLLAVSEHRVAGLIRFASRSIELLRERRATLITAAVSGQIDLRAQHSTESLEPV